MLKYNILLEGIIKEFTRIEPKHVDFILTDSDGNEYQCFSRNIKKKLSVSDEVLIIGYVSSGDKININYIINKSKSTEEKPLKTKAKWRLYVNIILSITCLGLFIYIILAYFNVIPSSIALTPPVLIVLEDFYGILNLLTILIPLIALTCIFGLNSYSIFQNIRISQEVEKEKVRLEKSGKGISKIAKVSEEEPKVVEKAIEGIRCPDCGEILPTDAMFCSKCGKAI
ncbi:MAG: zinc-ribbon domain-containing protein [Candidatus Hermodarchaeota archaeon]